MRCIEDYHWFLRGGGLLTILFSVIVTGILVYLILHFIHNNKWRNYAIANRTRCPNCLHPVEETFIMCPVCHYKLKTNCPSCGKVVKTDWDICPYCETELAERKITTKK